MEGTPPPPPELPPPVPHAVPEEFTPDEELPPDPIVPPEMDLPPEDDPQACYPDSSHHPHHGYPEMHHQGYSDPHQQDMQPVHHDMHQLQQQQQQQEMELQHQHQQLQQQEELEEEEEAAMHPGGGVAAGGGVGNEEEFQQHQQHQQHPGDVMMVPQEMHIPPDNEVPPPAPDPNDMSGAEMNAVEGDGAAAHAAALAVAGTDLTELNNTQGGPVVVTETEQADTGEKGEQAEGRSDNCCDKLFRCLSHVPCASLAAWILLLLGLGGLCGSLLIGSQKTRALLNEPRMLWFMEFTLTGVVVAMFVLGTLFLVSAYMSSEPSSRRVFNSTAKNKCARGLNIFLLVFIYILTVCWLLACLLLAVPIVLVGLPYITSNECLNLHDFGFDKKEMCGDELKLFKTEAQDLLICYGVGYLSALFIIISMIHFMISISANITHLRDSRFATLNAYAETEELRNSKHSVIDTNM